MKTIKKADANNMMRKFLTEHKGQTVYFKALSDADKAAYVLCDQFNYFTFLKPAERLERAINNTISHRDGGYEFYNCVWARMIIAND